MRAVFWEGSVAASASKVASSAPVNTPGCGMKNMQRWQFSTTAQQDWCCPWTGTCALRIPLQLSPLNKHRKLTVRIMRLPEKQVKCIVRPCLASKQMSAPACELSHALQITSELTNVH